ncbi:MAG: HYR domain-containing protein [Bacteroidota bacterium]|nr:HYR domain-containing protein [Bacteroidota bacterium]
MRKIYLLLFAILAYNCIPAQTPVPMASQPGLTYTENFADIANWTNGFAAGIGANRFGAVAVNATGTIPDGVRITTTTATFATGTSGGVQKGSSQTPALQSIVLLATGSTDNTSSDAIDFFMDFTGVNAGTLSFDWASLNNSTGDRKGSLRVYYSIDGTSFTELATADVLNITNNILTSGSITSIALPAAFNNSATARLRFYYHNGSGGTTGSRPKISIDNLTVTATPLSSTVSVAAGANAAEPSTNGSFTINFSPATTASTDVNFAFTGSAGFGTDYTVSFSSGTTGSTSSSSTLTVPSGTSSVTVTILPIDDADIEGTESVSLTLSAPTGGYTLGTASANINLTDNDVAPTVSVAAGINAAEPSTNGTFNISLSSPAPPGGVTITYTLSGTATLTTDYSDPQSGSVTIAEGNSSGVITLNVIDDPTPELTETIIITLNTVTSPYTISTSSATINLTSDDVSPISLTGIYSQDFNTLAITGTTNVLPIPGWLLNETGGGARDNELYAADNGSSTTGDTYSYGATASTERALGSLQSGTLIPTFGSSYINNTGTIITKLRIIYTGEQWRLGTAGRNDRLDFQISTDATNLTTGTWADVDQLDFVAPNSTTVGAMDGNAAANRDTISFDITGISIPNGAGFLIRWNDFNATGADDGLAIDDFSIEANPLDLTPPAVLSLSPVNGATNAPLNTGATITFDEPVQKVTGNIVIKRAVDNSIFQTIAIISPAVTISSASVSFPLSGLESNTGYYIEIDNGALEDLSGNDFAGISGNSTWAFTTGINFYVADFNTCSSSLTDGFTQFSEQGAIIWGCTAFGRDPAAPAGTAPFPNAVQINGFAGGTNVPNIDWLISPSFDLTGTTFPLLSFWSRTAFNGLPLQLKVSTDYTGGDPALATWTDINGKFPSQTSNAWTLSENINLSAFKQTNVHFAFVYISTADDGARWTVDDVSIINSPVPPPPSLTVSTTDMQFTFVANGSTADKTFSFTGNDLTDDITLNASGPFQLSKDGASFSPSLSYTVAEANNISKTVFVRFAPTQTGQDFTGLVTVGTSSLSDSIDLKGTSIDPATTLEIVNWNMEWFGSTDPTLGPVNDSLQQANAQTVIQSIGADLYGLVEVVDTARLGSIVRNMPGYSYVVCNYGSHTNPNEGGAGPLSGAQKEAFVYKTSMFSNITTTPLLTLGVNTAADLSNPAYNYWSSGRYPFMMSADVTLNCVTKNIKFVLVHSKANTSPTATAYDRRKKGADSLYFALNQMFPNDNILILGDFNDDLDKSITAGFTTTSWNAFTDDTINYKALTLPLSLAGKRSTVTFNDVIDHVVASNEMASFYLPESANILNDVANLVSNYGTTTSDHYPAFTRYKFEQPPPPVITCPGNIEQTNGQDTCGAVVNYNVTYSGNCGNAVLQQTTGLPSGSIFPVGVTTNTFVVTDAAGGTATCSFTVTIHDTQKPTISCPGNIVKNTDPGTCGAIVTYSVTYGDNCSKATLQQIMGLASGATFPAGVTVNKFAVTDSSGNTDSCSFTVTVSDHEAPTFTRPADKTIPFTTTCSYDATPAVAGDVTDEHDNCSSGIQATYTDQVTSCGNIVTITRTWNLSDDNGNKAPNQVQTITVTDNKTTYIVYATQDAKFGDLNFINGSVGVTAANGTAIFKPGTILPSPNFVKAKNIQVALGAFVPNRFNTPANDGPNPPFFDFAGITSGLPSLTISASTSVPVSANYKTLTIKKNISVIITGTLYGKIDIQEGAQVTFSPPSGVVNIESLTVTGKGSNITRIKFGNCTSVRIKDNVTIDQSTLVNVDGPKVTFYLGDNNSDDEQFIVKGDNDIVSANVYIKKGLLSVNGNVILMKGWFIAEKVENGGSLVVWDDNNCTSSSAAREFTEAHQPVKVQSSESESPEALTVKVSPNPSTDHFTLLIRSSDDTPVVMRVTDMSGRIVSVRPGVSSNSSMDIGSDWKNGVYFVEVIQGKEKQVIRLIKL